NGNQVSETNENVQLLRATFNSSFFTDGYVDASSGYPEKDIIGDGLGRMLYDADRQVYQAEFLIPLIEDASGQDANITSSTRYQIELRDSFQPTVPAENVAKLFDDGAWETIPLNDLEESYSHPQLPTNLTGLIVFVSSHEDSAGEIYTLDPATGQITRVTNNSLPEDGVSLSNDRTRIAFHAQSDASNVTSFEIYTINVDGSNQIQLTDDSFANAHPAWSPDDSKISYSPIFPVDTATVVIMTSSGQFLRNITPAGIEDADAEYLPDGRIVMKTNRWNALPQLQTGVMDDFGNNVKQLTFIENVSDHDPIGNDTHVIFERYMKGTKFDDDPEAIVIPWNIVEARLDGGGETNLRADGWMNFIPVYDPSDNYILYVRGPHFQEAVLMTRSGEILGRLIPDITKISYLDWK
ncbi:tolB protein precursor, periplasmic protein involved in the tonb-independent uptake of group A colicins, partial [hydrothermal vent metagenome]